MFGFNNIMEVNKVLFLIELCAIHRKKKTFLHTFQKSYPKPIFKTLYFLKVSGTCSVAAAVVSGVVEVKVSDSLSPSRRKSWKYDKVAPT
jgi:hypothetical protein